MLLPALLALSLVAGQADPYDDEFQDADHGGADTGLFVVARGGSAYDANGGPSVSVVGGEIGWSFEALDLSVAGYGYRGLRPVPVGEKKAWDPVVLMRLGQRFETYRGLEGTLDLGLGAARIENDKWRSWVQLAMGVHLAIDPLFVTGEITFEQNGLIRLTGGLGARF